MRSIVDLPENQVKSLDLLGKKNDVSRAELVRQAVDLYLNYNQKKETGDIVGHDIFGTVTPGNPDFWEGMDGLAWQHKMRAEWDERDAMCENWGLHEQEDSGFTHKPKGD